VVLPFISCVYLLILYLYIYISKCLNTQIPSQCPFPRLAIMKDGFCISYFQVMSRFSTDDLSHPNQHEESPSSYQAKHVAVPNRATRIFPSSRARRDFPLHNRTWPRLAGCTFAWLSRLFPGYATLLRNDHIKAHHIKSNQIKHQYSPSVAGTCK
jgi:hypothetical protein